MTRRCVPVLIAASLLEIVATVGAQGLQAADCEFDLQFDSGAG